MSLKIICGIIIILGFTYGGFVYAESLKNRLKQLSNFCDGLSMLEFNVRYMNFPIAEALFNTAKTCEGEVKNIFALSASLMFENAGRTPGEAFDEAIDKNERGLSISNDDIEILKSFSKTLGKGDKETELNNIKTTKLRLMSALDDASVEILKKVKMCKGMGALLGVLLVVVLF